APVRLRGLYRVIVQVTEQVTGEAALEAVAARLSAARGLGSDFEIELAGTFPIGVRAVIEIGAVEDPAALMAEIVEGLEAYLAPAARFDARAEARFEGPPLAAVLAGP